VSETLQATIDRIGPAPGDDPVERLAHTLRVYGGQVEDWAPVVDATRNVYADGFWTGLTWGDLRVIYDLLANREAAA
jgi:hypothetical protein